MSPTETYACKSCGGKKDVDTAAEGVPECCDAPMEKVPELDTCTATTTAEHSRMDQMDEPCDDGRSGNI